jgi:sporulation integral membrane protein YlbJ
LELRAITAPPHIKKLCRHGYKNDRTNIYKIVGGVKILKRIKVTLLCLFSAVGVIILLFFGRDAASGVRDGLTMCGNIIIPSLFPFLILSGFIAMSGAAEFISRPLGTVISPLFRLPGSASAAVLLSFISGYPVGAKMVRELYESGKIDRPTAERMLIFTINAGPAMIIFAVGDSMLHSSGIGWALYASHILSSVIIGAVHARFSPPCTVKAIPERKRKSPADAFVEATASACTSMLVICGYVLLFAAAIGILDAHFPAADDIVSPLLEVTIGCMSAAKHGIPMVAAVLGFGGISVIFQVLSLSNGLIRTGVLITARLINAAVSFIVCSVLIRIIPDTVQAVSNGVAAAPAIFSSGAPAAAAMLLTAAVMLFSLGHKDTGI